MSQQKDLENKIIVITGASRGIGRAASVEAAKRGAHIIACARTKGALEELDDEINNLGGSATLVPFSLRDFEAIDNLGAQIFKRFGRIDALIGNAGMLGTLSPVAHFSPKDFENVVYVNFIANFRLIRSMDLLLRKSDTPRLVFVSSEAAKSCKPFWGLYAASKAALDALIKSYALENANMNIRANIFYPGAVRTAMRAKAMPGEDPNTLPHPNEIAPLLINMVSPKFTKTGKIFNAATNKFSDL